MRGGGIRSHLDAKSHVLCQPEMTHRIIAPGPRDSVQPLSSEPATTLELQAGPHVPYDPSYHLLWRPDRVARSIAAFRPHVLEVHSAYLAALAALRAPRDAFEIRTLVWHSDHVGTYLEPWLRPRFGALTSSLVAPLWAGIRALTGAFAATFVASRTQRDALVAHGAQRVVLLPFGVDRSVFAPGPASPSRTVVACGRMAVEKRWDVILHAFAEAARERPTWRLLALGDGPERAKLERLAARLLPPDRVHFAGFLQGRTQLAAALASADVFLHGCPSETFGLSVAEALSCGLAAVVPSEGGAGEWVDGQRVRGFAGSRVQQAASALGTFMDVPRTRLRELPMPEILDVHAHFARLLEHYTELRQGAKHAA